MTLTTGTPNPHRIHKSVRNGHATYYIDFEDNRMFRVRQWSRNTWQAEEWDHHTTGRYEFCATFPTAKSAIDEIIAQNSTTY